MPFCFLRVLSVLCGENRGSLGSTSDVFLWYKHFMAVSKELLDILACPVCIKSVHLTADGKGLRCEQCKRIYPIVDDIPVMLIEEATMEQPAEQK